MTNREIDAAVAEKVFGWKPWRSKHGYWNVDTHDGKRYDNFGNYSTDKFDPETGKRLREPKWWEVIDEIPHYSTDPAASKQVRDKMRTDGWSWALTWLTEEQIDAPAHFVADFSRLSDKRVHVGQADTEELAVAIAALRAVGVEVEGA